MFGYSGKQEGKKMNRYGNVPRALVLAAALILGERANAQQSQDFKAGYSQGYKDGFDAGYNKGLAEAGRAVEATSKGFPIAVTAATYGPEGSSERCDATRYVRKAANGQRSVSVSITNGMCGDPAPGKRKSCEITYLCGSVAKTASAYEHRSAYLYCD